MDDTLYWVWLQCALGISSSLRTQEIVEAFHGGAREIYEANDYDRRIAGVFTNMQLDKLRRTGLEQAEAVLEECLRQRVHILTPRGADYPERLRQIPNHPLALYVKGSLRVLQNHLPVAIVGTRRADHKSVDIAGRLSADLTRAGCAIVSGGALGIDSASHWGALHANGSTVAVLGCGLATNYLPENVSMREKIAATGAVISEFPGSTAPLGRHFPIRNRIISGLSVGTVVIEANERSGSLITATCAAEQGRDVFAVPGDAFGSAYTGGNKLIREGAKPVFSAMDVLEEYELLYPELLNMRHASRDLERAAFNPADIARSKRQAAVKTKSAPKPMPLPISDPAKPAPMPLPKRNPAETKLLTLLQHEPQHIDALSRATALPFGELFAALMALEIDGLIRQTPGKIYELVN